jgi:GNAT superfamily N-acetyltransferase
VAIAASEPLAFPSEKLAFPSEALIAVHVGGTLAAVGGITRDPVMVRALRMRRFYVRRAFRGRGIGRRLVEALLDGRHGEWTVVVNAGRRSSRFWEAVGFASDARDEHTHVLL